MSYIPLDLRRQVVSRVGNRCEYCQLSQEGQAATFHVDHGISVIGKTAIGRATVATLKMNRPLMMAIREEEALIGRHPPSARRQ